MIVIYGKFMFVYKSKINKWVKNNVFDCPIYNRPFTYVKKISHVDLEQNKHLVKFIDINKYLNLKNGKFEDTTLDMYIFNTWEIVSRDKQYTKNMFYLIFEEIEKISPTQTQAYIDMFLYIMWRQFKCFKQKTKYYLFDMYQTRQLTNFIFDVIGSKCDIIEVLTDSSEVLTDSSEVSEQTTKKIILSETQKIFANLSICAIVYITSIYQMNKILRGNTSNKIIRNNPIIFLYKSKKKIDKTLIRDDVVFFDRGAKDCCLKSQINILPDLFHTIMFNSILHHAFV